MRVTARLNQRHLHISFLSCGGGINAVSHFGADEKS
jgi:hypothetical protein